MHARGGQRTAGRSQFYHVGPVGPTQVLNLSSKQPLPLSHPVATVSRYSPIVIVNFDCQFDWMKRHLRY